PVVKKRMNQLMDQIIENRLALLFELHPRLEKTLVRAVLIVEEHNAPGALAVRRVAEIFFLTDMTVMLQDKNHLAENQIDNLIPASRVGGALLHTGSPP